MRTVIEVLMYFGQVFVFGAATAVIGVADSIGFFGIWYALFINYLLVSLFVINQYLLEFYNQEERKRV